MSMRSGRLMQVLAADPRKGGMLAVLMVVLLALAIKTFVPFGPGSSEASDAEGPEHDDPAVVGKNVLSRTWSVLDNLRAGHFVEVPLSPRLSRNLFSVNESYFPLPAQTAVKQAPPAVTPLPEIESEDENADEAHALMLAQIRQDAGQLILRSVIVGSNPLAVVQTSGGLRTVVELGESVNGFELVEVKSDAVVLEKDNVRVRLWLAVQQR